MQRAESVGGSRFDKPSSCAKAVDRNLFDPQTVVRLQEDRISE
jgi:hypothetical protein